MRRESPELHPGRQPVGSRGTARQATTFRATPPTSCSGTATRRSASRPTRRSGTSTRVRPAAPDVDGHEKTRNSGSPPKSGVDVAGLYRGGASRRACLVPQDVFPQGPTRPTRANPPTSSADLPTRRPPLRWAARPRRAGRDFRAFTCRDAHARDARSIRSIREGRAIRRDPGPGRGPLASALRRVFKDLYDDRLDPRPLEDRALRQPLGHLPGQPERQRRAELAGVGRPAPGDVALGELGGGQGPYAELLPQRLPTLDVTPDGSARSNRIGATGSAWRMTEAATRHRTLLRPRVGACDFYAGSCVFKRLAVRQAGDIVASSNPARGHSSC